MLSDVQHLVKAKKKNSSLALKENFRVTRDSSCYVYLIKQDIRMQLLDTGGRAVGSVCSTFTKIAECVQWCTISVIISWQDKQLTYSSTEMNVVSTVMRMLLVLSKVSVKVISENNLSFTKFYVSSCAFDLKKYIRNTACNSDWTKRHLLCTVYHRDIVMESSRDGRFWV